MIFYALYNETWHEEILGLGSSETVKKGTKKYAAPVFFFFCRFYRCKSRPYTCIILYLILMAERCLKSHRCTALATAVGLQNRVLAN